MSAELLGLAFKAQMGSHVRKLVLLKLVDAAEDDGTSIWPAVATIAKAAESHARTVQKVISLFREVGLLQVVSQGGAGPGDTTEYRLDVPMLRRIRDEGWDAVTSGAGDAENGSKGGLTPPLDDAEKGGLRPPLDAERVASDSNKGESQATQPLQDPSVERERREREGESRRMLADLIKAHPHVAHDDPDRIDRAWAGLPARAQREAHERHADWLADRGRRTAIAALSTYLGKRMWTLLPPKAKPADRPDAPAFAGAWDRAWCWLVFDWIDRHGETIGDRDSAAAQQISRRFSAAANRIGWRVTAAELARIEGQAAAMVWAASDGPEFAAWRGMLGRRFGIQLPIPDTAKGVWLPCLNPEDWPAMPAQSEDVA